MSTSVNTWFHLRQTRTLELNVCHRSCRVTIRDYLHFVEIVTRETRRPLSVAVLRAMKMASSSVSFQGSNRAFAFFLARVNRCFFFFFFKQRPLPEPNRCHVGSLKAHSVVFVWESMFTRSRDYPRVTVLMLRKNKNMARCFLLEEYD